MSEASKNIQNELERMLRVADMLCSGHASLRDRYSRRAIILDLTILGLSVWLVALALAEKKIIALLTPFGWDSQLLLGVSSAGVFFLSLIQLKTDWKGRSDAHKRTLDIYSEVKRDVRWLLATGAVEGDAWRKILACYDMASAVGVEIPEREFLCQKRSHKIKVAISKHLDQHPLASLPITYLRLWFRDNVRK